MRKALIAVLILATLVPPTAVACERCVIGGDNLAYCRPSFYLPHWPLIADCEPITRCHRLANGEQCYPDCDGQWCYEV